MSKLVPNKKTYVKRLKAMLNSRKEPCEYCPCGRRYDPRWVTEVECEICQDFVGFHHIRQGQSTRACPCFRIGKQRAITRALHAIEAYEAGTHKWCKEKP